MSFRKLVAWSLAGLFILTAPADAVTFMALKDLGYQQMNSLGSATALPSIPAGAQEAFIICTGAVVNWRSDGTAPTASVGMPLPIDTPFPYTGSLTALQLIQASASAVCNVTYFGS